MGTAENGKTAADAKSGYKDRFWIPRFWDGMCLGGWVGLLVRNRFAVAPKRIAMAVIIFIVACVNCVLWLIQNLLLGRKIQRAKIDDDPIFVIGHWRSGTTLLHELLVLDPRHTFPDTYACFAPNHFLVSGWWMRPCLQFLLPSRRPMDNMVAGWDRPQEDEFALCNMGAPLAVSDERVSEPSAAMSGVSRHARRAGCGAGSLEARRFSGSSSA